MTVSPCECRCGYTCLDGNGRRTCGLDLFECIDKHYKEDCDHVFDGPWIDIDERSGSTTCSKCGMTSMHHGMACGP